MASQLIPSTQVDYAHRTPDPSPRVGNRDRRLQNAALTHPLWQKSRSFFLVSHLHMHSHPLCVILSKRLASTARMPQAEKRVLSSMHAYASQYERKPFKIHSALLAMLPNRLLPFHSSKLLSKSPASPTNSIYRLPNPGPSESDLHVPYSKCRHRCSSLRRRASHLYYEPRMPI